MRILVIDDDEVCRKTVQMILEESGFVCDTLPDGTHIYNKLKQYNYDLIISDIVMPEIGGMELVKIFKAMPNLSNISIVAMTGYIDNKEELLDSGFDEVLEKPITRNKVLEIVNSIDIPIENTESSVMIKELFEIFQRDSMKSMNIIKAAFNDKDWNNIAYHAHRLKGAASYVFADKVKNLSDTINKNIKQKDYKDIENLINKLENELNKFLESNA